MEITSVRIRKEESTTNNCIGKAKVELDNCFIINNIRIYEVNGIRKLQFPNFKTKDGHFSDLAHPKNQETREYFEKKIFEEFDNPSETEI